MRKEINVLNSSRTLEQVLNSSVKNGFIHRKNMGEHIRFNPSFKEFVEDRRLHFFIEGEEQQFLYVSVGDSPKHGVRIPKAANMKASMITQALDMLYSERTNRYSLIFDRVEDGADVFVVEPAEPVEEVSRPISEERRQQLVEQLAKAREARNLETMEQIESELDTVEA